MIKLKFKDIHSNPYVLSELILTAKIMRKKNFKIQMLAGNTLKIGVGGSFEISTTLMDSVNKDKEYISIIDKYMIYFRENKTDVVY